MPAELSEKERAEFREVFNLIDNSGTGRITQQELRCLMEVLRLRPTEEELSEMFAEAKSLAGGITSSNPPTAGGDVASGSSALLATNVSAPANSAATIGFEQFVTIMSRRVQSEYTPEQLRNAFKLFETEDLPVGTVSTEVLEHALMTYGTEKLSQEEAARLLAAVDPEGTGKINYLDFVSLVADEEK